MIGTSVGAYKVVRELGDGGQGSVYEAIRATDGARVALKVIHAHLRDELAHRARLEARLLASMQDEGLPRFVELIEDGKGPIAVAMELIDGVPMTATLTAQPMNAEEKRAFLIELARILAVLHGRGAVHRDIKPANVLIRRSGSGGFRGRVVLVDLALAKEPSGSGATQAGLVMGTPQFLAPEFLLGKSGSTDATAAADVFGWGVIAWFVLFGHHPTGLPLDAEPIAVMRAYSQGNQAWLHPAAAEALVRHSTDAGLVTAAIRALRDDPRARPQNGAELLSALQQWGAPTGVVGLAAPGHFTALNVQTWKAMEGSAQPSAPLPDSGPVPLTSLPADQPSQPRWRLLALPLAGVLIAALGAGGVWLFAINATEPPPLPPAQALATASPENVAAERTPVVTATPTSEPEHEQERAPTSTPEPATTPEPAATTQPQARGGLVTIRVNVTIDSRKLNGAKWDVVQSLPDPGLTARVESDGRAWSASGADNSTKFSATFTNVQMRARDTLVVTLVDRDVSVNDSIGTFRATFHGRAASTGGRAGAANFSVRFTAPR